MAEFKMPRYKYKGDTIPLDKCYRELSTFSYEPLIEIIHRGWETKLENDIFEAIFNCDISVDKDELIKALKYDRDQYEKGFIDGCKLNTDTIKAKIAKEIFEELEHLIEEYSVGDVEYPDFLLHFMKCKKKYTGENN